MRLHARANDWRFLWIVLGIVVIDQLTKFFASRIPLGTDIPLLGDFLALTHAQNTGAAFSMLQGQNIILAAITIIILATIAWYYPKIKKEQLVLVALITGGAMGNLIDRVRLGYVTDLIRISIWPAFNVADAAVTIGALVLAYHIIKEKR